MYSTYHFLHSQFPSILFPFLLIFQEKCGLITKRSAQATSSIFFTLLNSYLLSYKIIYFIQQLSIISIGWNCVFAGVRFSRYHLISSSTQILELFKKHQKSAVKKKYAEELWKIHGMIPDEVFWIWHRVWIPNGKKNIAFMLNYHGDAESSAQISAKNPYLGYAFENDDFF